MFCSTVHASGRVLSDHGLGSRGSKSDSCQLKK